jgi:hypothetical protein
MNRSGQMLTMQQRYQRQSDTFGDGNFERLLKNCVQCIYVFWATLCTCSDERNRLNPMIYLKQRHTHQRFFLLNYSSILKMEAKKQAALSFLPASSFAFFQH